MKLIESYGIEEAPKAQGHVVVIDVIRAFTTAAFAFHQGAEKIVLVKTPEEAFELRKKFASWLLAGEEGGKQIQGFDFGNSPEAISKENLQGRTVVLRSSSGTQGVVSATSAQKIYLGSLVVASATMKALRKINPEVVTLLAMGSPKGPDKEEDLACRHYMSCLLQNKPVDKEEIIETVRKSPAGQQAYDPQITWKTPGDLERVLEVDRFNFAMAVEPENGLLIASKLSVN